MFDWSIPVDILEMSKGFKGYGGPLTDMRDITHKQDGCGCAVDSAETSIFDEDQWGKNLLAEIRAKYGDTDNVVRV